MWGGGPKKTSKKALIDEGLTFSHVVTTMIDRCDMEEIELMAVMARKIWFRRNALVHGEDFTYPNQVFCNSSSSLDDFKRVNTKEMDAGSPTYQAPPTLWQKPPIGMCKVNWDEAVDKVHGRVEIGIIE